MTGRRTSTKPLVFFPNTTKKDMWAVVWSCCLTSREAFLALSLEGEATGGDGVSYSERIISVVFSLTEFREALPLPKPFHVMVLSSFLLICAVSALQNGHLKMFSGVTKKRRVRLFLFFPPSSHCYLATLSMTISELKSVLLYYAILKVSPGYWWLMSWVREPRMRSQNEEKPASTVISGLNSMRLLTFGANKVVLCHTGSTTVSLLSSREIFLCSFYHSLRASALFFETNFLTLVIQMVIHAGHCHCFQAFIVNSMCLYH